MTGQCAVCVLLLLVSAGTAALYGTGGKGLFH